MSTLNRLVLWNIDHTLVDVGRVTRDAYAEAFQRTIGRPLVRLAPTPGRTESEIIFETLAFNDVVTTDDHLPAFMTALAEAFATRRSDVRAHGRVLAGAREAVEALSHVPGVVQSVLTGSVQPNAVVKVTELGLAPISTWKRAATRTASTARRPFWNWRAPARENATAPATPKAPPSTSPTPLGTSRPRTSPGPRSSPSPPAARPRPSCAPPAPNASSRRSPTPTPSSAPWPT